MSKRVKWRECLGCELMLAEKDWPRCSNCEKVYGIEKVAFRRQLAVGIASGLVIRTDYLSEETAYSDFAEEVWKLAWAVTNAEAPAETEWETEA